MTVLDTNVVAVVLPTITCDLGASFADVAAAVAGLSAVVVAIQMRSARSRSSSQTAFTVAEEDRSVSKPIVRAASVRAAPLVFDATRIPDAAAGGTEREDSCSA